jgi:ABC-type lipoprotein export system ATPase subunit
VERVSAGGTDVSALELTDVFRVYSTPEGDAAALQGLSLRVAEGEVVVVLGPSGSGKTTLLALLAGLDRASAGSVRVFGRELGKLPQRRLDAYRAQAVGYVDQHYSRALAPELSAREIAGLQLGLAGMPSGDRDARTTELLARVGLAAKEDARPYELSGGEQQRLAVCAALAHRPRLLLADEPTGELDAANASEIYALIGGLAREQGSTTVIVSHDPTSAKIADRVISIRDGRVSEEASAGVAEESIVVGRGGWLRLPEELLARAGIGSRATARLEDRRVVVSTADGGGAVDVDALPALPAAAAAAGRVVAEIESVAKTFRSRAVETAVFDGLDAAFAAARLHAVTGPSGSGKTTLLRLLSGLEIPSAGKVTVLGTEISGLDREARADFRRRHVALVAQETGLIPFLSARENVELGLDLRESNASLGADEALAAVGLSERAGQRVSRLSAGEQTRVDVARAVAPRPALLLADEPTARLDQANALAVVNLLARLARETGAAVVCATHDPIVIDHADEELQLQVSERVEDVGVDGVGLALDRERR